MKTFDDEYRELVAWRMKRFEETRKLPNDGIGLDASGQRGKQEWLDGEEYRRRLRALKEKYQVIEETA